DRGGGADGGDVHQPEVHPPGPDETLARAVAGDVRPLDRLRHLGRLGGFRGRKPGALGADRDLALPRAGRDRAADHPRRHPAGALTILRRRIGFPSFRRKLVSHSRDSTTPATITAAASAFSRLIRSPTASQPISTAKRIEVSRSAATSAMGAKVIAQTETA